MEVTNPEYKIIKLHECNPIEGPEEEIKKPKSKNLTQKSPRSSKIFLSKKKFKIRRIKNPGNDYNSLHQSNLNSIQGKNTDTGCLKTCINHQNKQKFNSVNFKNCKNLKKTKNFPNEKIDIDNINNNEKKFRCTSNSKNLHLRMSDNDLKRKTNQEDYNLDNFKNKIVCKTQDNKQMKYGQHNKINDILYNTLMHHDYSKVENRKRSSLDNKEKALNIKPTKLINKDNLGNSFYNSSGKESSIINLDYKASYLNKQQSEFGEFQTGFSKHFKETNYYLRQSRSKLFI